MAGGASEPGRSVLDRAPAVLGSSGEVVAGVSVVVPSSVKTCSCWCLRCG